MTNAQPNPSPNLPPNFDRLAPLYRWMEVLSFGPWLGLCRREFLHQLLTSRHALVLGDGDGRFTATLLRANPQIHIDAVDVSPRMLQVLVAAAGPDAARVRPQCADLRAWRPSLAQTDYDLVATHFVLDCLTTAEVRALVERIRPALRPGALWVVSEFSIPLRGLSRPIARLLVASLYRAFGWLTGLAVRQLPDHRTALNATGFKRLKCQPRLCGILLSELWQLGPDSLPASEAEFGSRRELLQSC